MLYFSRWKAAAILLTAFLVCACSPCRISFPRRRCSRWPTWAQRHVVLGLDLQGGSHILLEVDTNAVRKEKVETLRDDVRRVLRENRLGYPAAATIRGNTVEVRIREGVDPQLALDQAARAVAAARRHPERDRPALGRRRRRRQRPDPAHRRPSPPSSSASARRSSSRSRSSSGASTSSARSSRRSSARASTASWCRCRACRIRRG